MDELVRELDRVDQLEFPGQNARVRVGTGVTGDKQHITVIIRVAPGAQIPPELEQFIKENRRPLWLVKYLTESEDDYSSISPK